MKRVFIGLSAAVMMLSVPAFAAPPGGGNPAQSAMERIYRFMSQSFSARAEMTIDSPEHKMPGPMEFALTMSQGKSRMEIDMDKMVAAAGGKGGDMPGMGKMITISRPDRKVVYQVMPALKGYAEMPISDAAGKGDKEPKVDRKVEGAETVEGYDCERVRNTVTLDDGTTVASLTWEAKELKGLPVKVQTATPEGTVTMVFKDIKTSKPADSLFEPPTGLTKYNSFQELMMSGMMNMMQQKGR